MFSLSKFYIPLTTLITDLICLADPYFPDLLKETFIQGLLELGQFFEIVEFKLMRLYSVWRVCFPSLIIISRKVKSTENIHSVSLMLFTEV